MKFMISWKAKPGNHKPAGEGFLETGAPMPDGLSMLGRWHAPGSVRGWALVECSDLKALYEHTAQWANLLELQSSPVLEDDDAGQALSRVYGK
jgi:Domain of unknown function (DUF3303)